MSRQSSFPEVHLDIKVIDYDRESKEIKAWIFGKGTLMRD